MMLYRVIGEYRPEQRYRKRVSSSILHVKLIHNGTITADIKYLV